MHKPLTGLTKEALDAFVAQRRERRAYRPKRVPLKTKRLTVARLAKAWNVPKAKLQEKLLQLAEKGGILPT